MNTGGFARNIALPAGLILALLLLTPTPSLAADWYVSATLGSDTTGDGSQGNPWRTIGRGGTACSSPCQIKVAEGIYYETVTVPNQTTILGGYDPLFTERIPSVHRTVIDGGLSATAAVVCPDGNTMTMDGLATSAPRRI